MEPLLRLLDVTKTFPGPTTPTTVLAGVGLELARGSATSLVGASGSGKSTLLGLVAGLALPDSGTIVFDGLDITSMDDSGRARLRASRLGVVAQSGNLIPFLTAAENVELAAKLAQARSRRAARTIAQALLGEFALSHRATHLPRHLSGGEAQRVALAMALAHEPDLLLADEMTGELDGATAEQAMRLVLARCRARGLTLLFVTHSDALARLAESRLVLVDTHVGRA